MKQYRITPGSTVRLDKIDPDDTGSYKENAPSRRRAESDTQALLDTLQLLQERLYATADRALLIVLQAMDTGGKDSTIKHVMSGVNPQGCRVTAFKAPTPLECTYDFLWRVHREAPPKGYIGIFNRSHYEDVLITRVHGLVSKQLARQRFTHINNFEQLLYNSGTVMVKFFLHISQDEQRQGLEEWVRDPEKRWKFNPQDLKERQYWDTYMQVYEDVIAATSTDYAPWYIVPANHKWYRNLVLARTIVAALKNMHLKSLPEPPGVDGTPCRLSKCYARLRRKADG